MLPETRRREILFLFFNIVCIFFFWSFFPTNSFSSDNLPTFVIGFNKGFAFDSVELSVAKIPCDDLFLERELYEAKFAFEQGKAFYAFVEYKFSETSFVGIELGKLDVVFQPKEGIFFDNLFESKLSSIAIRMDKYNKLTQSIDFLAGVSIGLSNLEFVCKKNSDEEKFATSFNNFAFGSRLALEYNAKDHIYLFFSYSTAIIPGISNGIGVIEKKGFHLFLDYSEFIFHVFELGIKLPLSIDSNKNKLHL